MHTAISPGNKAETDVHGCHCPGVMAALCACAKYWLDLGLVFECVTRLLTPLLPAVALSQSQLRSHDCFAVFSRSPRKRETVRSLGLEVLVCLSTMFVEAVFKSTFGFSYLLFVHS